MTDHPIPDDLVARLRDRANADWRGYPPDAIYAEAADRLEALGAERDTLAEAMGRLLDGWEAAEHQTLGLVWLRGDEYDDMTPAEQAVLARLAEQEEGDDA